MNLHLRVCHPRLAFDVAACLEEKQLGAVQVTVEPTERFALHYRPGVSLRSIAALLDALAPLIPEEIQCEEVEDGHDVVLWLGEAGFHERLLHVYSDTVPHATQLARQLGESACRAQAADRPGHHHDVLLYSGVSRFPLLACRWHLLRKGIDVPAREDANYNDCFALFLHDPSVIELPAGKRFAVEVACDDDALGQELLDLLGRRGFALRSTTPLPDFEAETQPFAVWPGVFTAERFPHEHSLLHGAVHELCRRLGVDTSKFPVSSNSGGSLTARIVAPLGAVRSGRKVAYAGGHPERFQVTLVTDDAARVAPLRTRLHEAGFRKIDVLVRPSLIDGPDDGGHGEFYPGYVVTWNEAASHHALVSLLTGAMRSEMAALGAKNYLLRRYDSCVGDPTTIRLYFPVGGVEDGKLQECLAQPRHHRLRIRTGVPEGWKPLVEELRSWQFADFNVETNSNSPMLYYGGAPELLREKIRSLVLKHHGPDLSTNKAWDDNNNELYLDLPDRHPPAGSGEEAHLPEEMTTQLEVWAYGETGPGPGSAFVEVQAERVRIGSVQLPRQPGQRQRLAPHPSSFSHFCLDRLTAATLEHIATSVLLREPCLLEGETSTSKTSSILYLASLLNQPVARINLNGQTDTGELIGRFVPQHLILELPLSTQELVAAADLLEVETRRILEKARRENRQLTRVEIQQIMAQEEMTSHPWRWEDGLVPRAMREGWWILLDEVNLAEPQILERLNSVLESDPALVLTEYDNSLIGAGGTPVHGNFRIFATMNPAEYAGRSVLSPAYRDRWRGYRFVARPGESEFLDMLCLLVYGSQPDFGLHGHAYVGPEQEPRYHRLAGLKQLDDFLEALARFHVSLEEAVGQTPDSMARIGGRRRERYVFTRRGLLSLLDYLSSPLFEEKEALGAAALRRGLLRYYLGRLSNAEDRALVIQLLDAHGLGPNTWKFSR